MVCSNDLRLIEKRVVDFLLVLIELGVTAETLRANRVNIGVLRVRGQFDPKFPSPTIFLVEN